MFHLTLIIVVIILNSSSSLTNASPDPLLKCTARDERRIFPYCMFDATTKALWCDQSNYKSFPSNPIRMHHNSEKIEYESVKAIYINESCLRVIDAGDLKRYLDVGIFVASQNDIKSVGKETFSANKKLDHIDLKENMITNITQGAFRDLKELKVLLLDGNRLKDIRFLHTDRFMGIEVLSLDKNQITKIRRVYFHTLRNITELRLRGNKISQIQDHGFVRLKNLMKLHLDENLLTTITHFTFFGLEKLKELTISKNQITMLPEHDFGFVNLHFLDLSNNQIVNITSTNLMSTPHLRHLMLQNNSIQAMPEDLFNSTPHLKHLNLSGNSLEDIPEYTFTRLCRLESLILENNKLKNLKEKWFRTAAGGNSLQVRFHMGGNPWHCDCTAAKFQAFHHHLLWTTDHQIGSILSEDISCSSPSFAQSRLLNNELKKEIDFRMSCDSKDSDTTDIKNPDSDLFICADHAVHPVTFKNLAFSEPDSVGEMAPVTDTASLSATWYWWQIMFCAAASFALPYKYI